MAGRRRRRNPASRKSCQDQCDSCRWWCRTGSFREGNFSARIFVWHFRSVCVEKEEEISRMFGFGCFGWPGSSYIPAVCESLLQQVDAESRQGAGAFRSVRQSMTVQLYGRGIFNSGKFRVGSRKNRQGIKLPLKWKNFGVGILVLWTVCKVLLYHKGSSGSQGGEVVQL